MPIAKWTRHLRIIAVAALPALLLLGAQPALAASPSLSVSVSGGYATVTGSGWEPGHQVLVKMYDCINPGCYGGPNTFITEVWVTPAQPHRVCNPWPSCYWDWGGEISYGTYLPEWFCETQAYAFAYNDLNQISNQAYFYVNC